MSRIVREPGTFIDSFLAEVHTSWPNTNHRADAFVRLSPILDVNMSEITGTRRYRRGTNTIAINSGRTTVPSVLPGAAISR